MPLFIELSLIVFIATLIAIIMRMLKQPLIVAYIVSGILVGPYFLDVLHATEAVELFSKIGISILLFIVGLNLNPETIKETGKASLIAGAAQMGITGVLGFFLVRSFGFDTVSALLCALALSFSSTIIVLKILSDKGDLGKLYGKISIGILLVQDIVATVALLAVAVIGAGEATEIGFGATIFDLLVKGSLVFIVLYLISKYILPKLSAYLAQSQELLFLFSIAWGLGLAALFYKVGFSIEIGALVAGVTLSVSTYAFEIGSRMKPLRDFFIIIFFILLGSQLVFSDIPSLIVPIITLSIFALIIKPLIVVSAMNLAGYRARTGFMSGISLAQISEFSLILMALAFSFGIVDERTVSMIAMVAMISIVGSTYLATYVDHLHLNMKGLLRFFAFKRKTQREPKLATEASDMIIFGYDRVGFDFVDAAQKLDGSYLVVDFNPHSITKLQAAQIPFRFGDAEDVEFLGEICLQDAKIVVSTIPDYKTNFLLLRTYRKTNAEGVIILISHDIRQAKELYLNGATYVIMPHYLGAHHASAMISQYGFDVAKFEKERNKHLVRLAQREKITSKLSNSN
jgi:Kef-type K+ transport system membrane component KefB/Trk K+ transport system NAD-binding subunit